jgi:putative transposase
MRREGPVQSANPCICRGRPSPARRGRRTSRGANVHLMKTALAGMDDRRFRVQPSATGVEHRGATGVEHRGDGAGLVWAAARGRFARRLPALPSRRSENFLRLLEPRRRHDFALLAAIREAYLTGASTRRVEAMAQALDLDGSRGEDVRLATRELDREIQAFRTRALDRAFPYLVIDAIGQKVRDHGRVQNALVVVVAGIAATGDREVLAVEVGFPDDDGFWPELLSGLHDRGVYGVRLITADPQARLEPAIKQYFPAATWQRSRIGFIREALAMAGEEQRAALGRALRDVFAQDDRAAALDALRSVHRDWKGSNPALAASLQASEESILAFYDMPARHRKRVNATTCLIKAHREVERHCRLIGIFPSSQSLLRLCGVMLEEHNDEWAAGRRYVGRRQDGRLRVALDAATSMATHDDAAARPMLRLVQAS